MPAPRVCPTLFVLSLAGVVHAQAQRPGPASATGAASAKYDGATFGSEATQSTRRSGVTLGLQAGPAVGRAVGYPNIVHQIDHAAYRASTGASLGGTGRLWFGGALRDWFTFAIGGSTTRLASNALDLQDWAVFCRVEAFPAFRFGGVWRDLSLYGDFGAGSALIFGHGSTRGDGGSMSHVGAGVAHETWRARRFVFGPSLGYYTLFSPSLEAHIGFVALRASFYGGP